MTKLNQIKKLCNQIDKQKQAIMDGRDKLRALYQDLDDICDSLDTAENDIDDGLHMILNGIDAMSQYI